jgi:hypothetical protein
MTPQARKSDLAKIHIGGAPSGSAADLTPGGIEAVLRHLYTLGFVPSRPLRAGKKPRMTASRQGLLDKIDAYLAEAKLSVKYTDGIARRMYKLDAVAFCNEAQLRGIISALDKQAKKAGRATA